MTKTDVLSALSGVGKMDPANVWVAGSAAIIPALAEDIDIWVIDSKVIKPKMFSPSLWTHYELPTYGSIIPLTAKIGCVIPPLFPQMSELKIEVMFTQGLKSIFDLLVYFDAPCHAFARNLAGFFVAGLDATLPGVPMPVPPDPDEMPAEHNCKCANCQAGYNKEVLHRKRIITFNERYADAEKTRQLLWLPS